MPEACLPFTEVNRLDFTASAGVLLVGYSLCYAVKPGCTLPSARHMPLVRLIFGAPACLLGQFDTDRTSLENRSNLFERAQ